MSPFSHERHSLAERPFASGRQFRNSCRVHTASPPMALFFRTTNPAKVLLFYSGADTFGIQHPLTQIFQIGHRQSRQFSPAQPCRAPKRFSICRRRTVSSPCCRPRRTPFSSASINSFAVPRGPNRRRPSRREGPSVDSAPLAGPLIAWAYGRAWNSRRLSLIREGARMQVLRGNCPGQASAKAGGYAGVGKSPGDGGDAVVATWIATPAGYVGRRTPVASYSGTGAVPCVRNS